ncbi:MAG: site-specific integrase, partial [Bacteroidota bacterium]
SFSRPVLVLGCTHTCTQIMATINIVLRKKKLANGNYPVVIRLSLNGSSATYLRIAGLSSTIEQWNCDLSRFNRNKNKYKELNKVIGDIESKVDSIASKLLASNKFTYKRFKDIYLESDKADDNVLNAFDKKIGELKQLNKTGSAKVCSDCKAAFEEYTKSKYVTFDDIDFRFLQGFKTQRLLKGNKINTISIYFRGLRAVHYNYCKVNNLNRPTAYLEIGIKTEVTKKRALSKAQLQKLINYTCLTYAEQRSIDLFFFSFYCRGINLMDIAQLTQSSIINDRIEYKRSKTSGLFSILITPEIQKILDKYATASSIYLFPILKSDSNIRNTVVNFNRTQNKILKRIALKLEIPHFSSYASRHSFASILRENNVSIDIISQSLGHSSVNTTKVYLNSFPNTIIDKVSCDLL